MKFPTWQKIAWLAAGFVIGTILTAAVIDWVIPEFKRGKGAPFGIIPTKDTPIVMEGGSIVAHDLYDWDAVDSTNKHFTMTLTDSIKRITITDLKGNNQVFDENVIGTFKVSITHKDKKLNLTDDAVVISSTSNFSKIDMTTVLSATKSDKDIGFKSDPMCADSTSTHCDALEKVKITIGGKECSYKCTSSDGDGKCLIIFGTAPK